ncbi:MAG: NAD(P)-dependent oxidoreductase [Ectothiorhodospiraceae bacterium]|nr:NAD(P)-dependent oxidoreductase [Chromatiales bacterium]MCP5154901.1 NAD(P)-dependent oxidoreductase [Ectothiorhodospiraceae bacterium]
MNVGFIGLGTMGAHIARNAIAGGHALKVHDLRREAAAPHIEAGATWADSVAAVADGVDVVLLSLPGPREFEAVTLGDGGLVHAMRPGQAVFDLTTNSPTVVRRAAAELASKGIQLLDAPVSGGPDGARTAKMAIWVGGDQATYDRFEPVLRSVSDQPRYIGPVGAGSIAKLVHNLSGYILQTALAETFTMGVKAGVEPEALWEAVRQGAVGRRRVFDTMSRQFLPGRFDPPDFALELARKDVALACEVGREFEVPMRLAHLTLQEMTEAMNRGWARRDSRTAMLLQEERAGVEVRIARDAIDAILKGD